MNTTRVSKKYNPSEKLRIIRKSKGWSLQDVEKVSKGKWKAVVIGSYERSDRAISLKKAIDLMEFYQVPISELFEEKKSNYKGNEQTAPIVLDQRLITNSTDSRLDGVRRLLSFLTSKRRDWNGEVLSVRNSDFQFIAMLLDLNIDEALIYLKDNSFIIS